MFREPFFSRLCKNIEYCYNTNRYSQANQRDCNSKVSNVQPLNLGWKWTKYEKWNCCPGFIPNPESISSNEINQNIEINQVCDHVQICLIDLHDLNSQINYSDK